MDKSGKSNEIRLQSALSNLGFASRRKAKEIIESGKVTVNGKAAINPHEKVILGHDIILVNGISKPLPEKTYILLNKPKGAVSTLKDKHAVITVADLIKKNC